MKKESKTIISVDDGGFSTCVVTDRVQTKFPSVKGLYGERNLTTTVGRHDFVVEYKDGETYVMGDLARVDCSLPLQWHGSSKQHSFFDLSVLVSVFMYGGVTNQLVVSVPITEHHTEEKEGRIRRLKGPHTLKVNGQEKSFYISDVIVAPETVSSFWINEPEGLTRWIDLGSRTIGYGTVFNEEGINRYIDTQSGCFQKGIEALGNQFNAKGLAEYICGRLYAKSWEKEDTVYLLGGGAMNAQLVEEIKKYFSKATVLHNPQMSNALGMFNLGCYAFQQS